MITIDAVNYAACGFAAAVHQCQTIEEAVSAVAETAWEAEAFDLMKQLYIFRDRTNWIAAHAWYRLPFHGEGDAPVLIVDYRDGRASDVYYRPETYGMDTATEAQTKSGPDVEDARAA